MKSISATAVSYTHLDVYKRQEIGRNFEEIAAIYEGVEHAERLRVCFDTCHTSDAGYAVKEDFDYVIAVSYTHLDVYKRQVKRNERCSTGRQTKGRSDGK